MHMHMCMHMCMCMCMCICMCTACALRVHCVRTACARHVHYLLVALQVLQWLPPAVAVVAHAEVAALLNDESRAVMAIAAHTLACLGPEAVCYPMSNWGLLCYPMPPYDTP